MEMSSFAGYYGSVGRRDSYDFDSQVEPLGYGSHHHSFKRTRSFSECGDHFNDLASQDGDNSLGFDLLEADQNLQLMSIYDRNAEVELDLDDSYSDYLEILKPIKKEDERLVITTTSPQDVAQSASQATNALVDEE